MFKITKIKSPLQSKLVQEKLFENGYEWPSSGNKVQSITPNSLFCEKGEIRFWYGDENYNPNNIEEIDANTFIGNIK